MLLKKAINKFLAYLESRNYSQSTLRGYGKELSYIREYLEKKYNGPVYLKEIDIEDLNDYLKYKMEVREVSAVTRNRAVYILKSFYSYLDKKDLMENIARKLEKIKERSKESVYLSEEEMGRLIAEIDKPLIRTTTIFLYNTGCRIGEALKLKINHLDFDNNKISIIQAKGNKDRTVSMNSRLKEELQFYLSNHRPDVDTDYVFATERSGSLSRVYYDTELKKAAKRADVYKKISTHTIRHSTAVALRKNGVDLTIIRDLLGHKSLKTTNEYLHSEMDEIDEALETINI